ncbi:hypothetical protein TNCV_2634921 [Trichonephila clavipes]|nr:hypothetical protein TNCV_2634921 [Trichonephila clavipes]
MERKKGIRTAADSQAGRCGMQPKPSSLRAQAQLTKTRTETMELLREMSKEQEKTKVREEAFPSRIHGNPSVRIATFFN